MLMPFHLAIPVNDLEETKVFYTDVLGCKIGRSSDIWCDFNFFGHQLTSHVSPDETRKVVSNIVDEIPLPVRHFGIVLSWDNWHELKDRLIEKKIAFISEPHVRFKGQVGEQATMYFYDPSYNAIEFKSFKQFSQLFESFDKLKKSLSTSSHKIFP